ncbi:MAG TPA: protein kinase, partial [Thermoanaerobaculia bacterium]
MPAGSPPSPTAARPRRSPTARAGDPDLGPLERLLGDLVVEEVLAETALAVVYRVRTGGHAEPLALKVARHAGDADELARFRHEVRLLSEARHPNVVAVHDSGVLPGGQPFLTMELLSPRPVAAALGEPRDWQLFADLAIQAAAGLAHIHRQGLIHLDVKPANLGLLETGGGPPRLAILDFGLARLGPATAAGGAVRGTLAYTAPEVLTQDAYDHRADLYSLGLTLYELATGSLPSAGGDRAALAFHLGGERPDPRAERPDMPAALAALVTRAIAPEPADRFASAAQMLVELGRAAWRAIAPEDLLGVGTLLSSRLIGRDEVVERLGQALAAAGRGRGAVVIVEGDEGMGKSRLLRELRLRAAIEGARVGAGHAPAEGERPLAALLAAAAAAGVELPLAPSPGGAAGDEADRRDRFRLYRDVAGRLGEEAVAGRPLVLLLDDLHRGGPEIAELVEFLAAEAPELPLLVVAAREPRAEPPGAPPPGGRRIDDPSPAVGDGDGGPAGPLVLPLAPFARDDTVRLVDASLGTAALPEAFYDRVHERSGGSPGRVGPLLRHLVDEKVLRLRGGAWKPSLPALHRWAATPESAQALDWQRLDHLPPGEREVLEAATLLDEPFRLGELAALLELDAEAAYERLVPLVAAGHLERVREAAETAYAFAHRRLRDSLYASLDAPRRGELHARRARDLERRGGDGGRSAAVAEHWWRAGERAAALPHLVAAARAAAVYAYPEAA